MLICGRATEMRNMLKTRQSPYLLRGRPIIS